MYDISFPNIGVYLKNIYDGITIFGFQIKFYGAVIALGFLLAYVIVAKEAKRTGQNPETYLDYLLWLVIPAILGARIYYVLFSWDSYFQKGQSLKDTMIGLINTRNGGLAIYGGVIAGMIVLIVFARKRKLKISLLTDTCIMGLLLGQILGRWGNFFNREAFGTYTDSLFAMQIPLTYFQNQGSLLGLQFAGVITPEMLAHTVNGCIQVHPTFLYESLWNLSILILILLYRKHKKFDGELTAIYFVGYGIGRFWIEALRTDSLFLPGIHLRASQVLAATLTIVGIGWIIYGRKYVHNCTKLDTEVEKPNQTQDIVE